MHSQWYIVGLSPAQIQDAWRQSRCYQKYYGGKDLWNNWVTSRITEQQDLESDEIWWGKVRCSSKINQRLRSERVVLSEELRISESCFLRLIMRNSVYRSVKSKIHDEICC